MQTTEINGFTIDQFNQYSLESGKTQGVCPLCSHTRKPENKKANVLHTIGIVVSALATIAVLLFSYIRIKEKVLASVFMLDLKLLSFYQLKTK